MPHIFNGCSSLTSLDLSSFDTSLVTNIESMFNGCINLEYINFINYNENGLSTTSSSSYYRQVLENVPKNIIICIDENNANKLLNQ